LLDKKKKKEKHLDNLMTSQIKIDKIGFDFGIENPEVNKLMTEAKQIEAELFENMKEIDVEEEFNEIVEKDEEYKNIFTEGRNFNVEQDEDVLQKGIYVCLFNVKYYLLCLIFNCSIIVLFYLFFIVTANTYTI